MRRNSIIPAVFCLFFVLLLAQPGFCGKVVTVTGTVNGYSIQADDGQVYELGDSAKSDELSDLSGKRVTATGTVEEDEYGMVINVTTYTILGDAPEQPGNSNDDESPGREPGAAKAKQPPDNTGQGKKGK